MKQKNKKVQEGNVIVQLDELDGYSFNSMDFFMAYIPPDCEVTSVQINHDYGVIMMNLILHIW